MNEVWRFDAIGVPWEIATRHPLSEDARTRITEFIAHFDADWSRFRPDSAVSRLAAGDTVREMLIDAEPLLDLYVVASGATEGAVSPLVGDALEALGYDRDYTLTPTGAIKIVPDWRSLLSWNGDDVALAARRIIDIGAVGKGRLADRVLALVPAEAGAAVVDASGDLAVRGYGADEPLRVGLEDPRDATRVVGVTTVTSGGVAASAVNRRAWGDGLHHVIDARTGEPVHTVMATWAIAPTAMLADAISTALFFDGGATWAESFGDDVEWVRMFSTGLVQHSPLRAIELFQA